MEYLELHSSRCNIPRVNGSSLTWGTFRSRYWSKRPVLIRLEPSSLRDLYRMLSRREFLKRRGRDRVLVGGSVNIVKKAGLGDREMSVRDFASLLEGYSTRSSAAHEDRPYAFDKDFFSSRQRATIRDAVVENLEFALEIDLQPTDPIFLFLGASGSGVSFHSHGEGFNIVTNGLKRWWLYPPHVAPPGGVNPPSLTMRAWYGRLYHNLTVEQHLEYHQCVQRPGEMMYVPDTWWHGTLNIGEVMAVGWQKSSSTCRLGEKLQQANALDNAISALEYKGGQYRAIEETMPMHRDLVAKWRRIVDMVPNSSSAWNGLGLALFNSGRDAEALDQYRRALALNPTSMTAINWLADHFHAIGDMKEALAYSRRAADINPYDDMVMRRLRKVERGVGP